jgi:hypothetical protein
MTRKSIKPAQKPTVSEDKSQAPPGEQAVGASPAGPPAKAVSKAQAARAAIDEGYESPLQAVAWIKTRFGIDMAPQHFSAVKSQTKQKQTAAQPDEKGEPKPKPADGYLAPPPKILPTGEGDLIDVLEKIKPLIAQYGPDKIKRLVDLLG